MTARRQLQFETLSDAVADAERLLAGGYTKAGQWDLAQVCGHLANWQTYPVDGFPKPPLPVRIMLGVVRPLMGRKLLAKYLKDGMPAGKPTIPQSIPAAGGDAAAAVERFKVAAARFDAHAGEYHPSPLFGPLTRAEAAEVQRRHAAHHLSFLVPNG